MVYSFKKYFKTSLDFQIKKKKNKQIFLKYQLFFIFKK